MPFGKLQADWHLPFTEEWLSDWWIAAEMVVVLEVGVGPPSANWGS